MTSHDPHEPAPLEPAAEPVDPAVADADRRAARAKASLRARFAELEHRLGDIRERIDVAAQIREHPLPAVGIALAIGALGGLAFGAPSARGGRRGGWISPVATAERSLGATALAAVVAIGLRIGRELVLGQVSRAARQWWDDHGGGGDYYEAIDVTPGGDPFRRPR